MENEQNSGKKNDPKDQARNLFFQSALTQSQIAELIGVSQKTVSLWINDGRWKQMKESTDQAPAVLIEQMTSELSEIHYNIASREPGKRFATVQEAEIRRKTMITIKYIKEQQTTGAHIEVLMNFMAYVRGIEEEEDANIIMKHADSYIAGERGMGSISQPFKPYSLPGAINIPAPSGLPPVTPDTPPSSSEQDDKPNDLNKAA